MFYSAYMYSVSAIAPRIGIIKKAAAQRTYLHGSPGMVLRALSRPGSPFFHFSRVRENHSLAQALP